MPVRITRIVDDCRRKHEIRCQEILMVGRRRNCDMHVSKIAFRSLIEARLPSYQSYQDTAAKFPNQKSLARYSTLIKGWTVPLPCSQLTGSVDRAEVDRSYARAKIGNSFRDTPVLRNNKKVHNLTTMYMVNFILHFIAVCKKLKTR